MKLLYFAWIRTKVGKTEETVELPKDVANVGDLLAWLRQRSPGFQDALGEASAIRVAVNQEYATPDRPVSDSDEIALFPPVTGG